MIRKEIGSKIAQLRKEAGLSQRDLADKAGLTQNTIYKIENGKFSVGIDVLDRVAKDLNRKKDIDKSEDGPPPRQSDGETQTKRTESGTPPRQSEGGTPPRQSEGVSRK